ncbi:hypothetical protein TeGR_g13701 [Tetraparma gracilis]|uniref:Uncharacterized protein n=1 Tax=Tetraparma gracilis TaxID=2962635 RepID=A0ABQ6N874_9STRA|nr:hypothetical protein TeGR_g13701 [Tetraparma gracilis]
MLVFDLGGGTFDCSLLSVTRLSSGRAGQIELLASSGDANLGGNDFDARVAASLLRRSGFGGWPKGTPFPPQMRALAEAVRVHLSSNPSVTLHLPRNPDALASLLSSLPSPPPLSSLSSPAPSLSPPLLYTRAHLEEDVAPLLPRFLRPLREIALLADVALLGDAAPGAVAAILGGGGGAAARKLDGGLEEFRRAMAGAEGGDAGGELGRMKAAQKGGRKRARALSAGARSFKGEKAAAARRAGGGSAREMPGSRMVDAVVLVGGATKTPLIAGLVSAVAGVAPTYVSGAPPDHSVALGAAVQVGVLDGAFEDEDPEGGLGVMNPLQAALLRALAKREGLI